MFEEHFEGQVKFLRPPIQKIPTTRMAVFFNPLSELNRDVSISSIHTFLHQHGNKAARVCTPLAGTGVRAIRIAKEIEEVQLVIAGDVNPLAVELAKKNSILNNVSEVVEVHHCDANLLLVKNHHANLRFDVIDIDPFGSPREFFPAAIGALRAHAFLCFTATDLPALVGIRRRACIKRYAAEPARTKYGHELAIRLLLGLAVREAAAQNFGLEPMLTFFIDHYVRLHCEAMRSDEAAWNSVSQLGYLLHCNVCDNRQITNILIPVPLVCPECNSTEVQRAGPLWTGSLANRQFVEKTLCQVQERPLGTKQRLSRLLQRLLEEIEGPATYYDIHELCDRLSISIPSFSSIIEELRERQHYASRTHFSPHAIRTSASSKILQAVLRYLTR